MATYVEMPEVLLSPNRRVNWAIAFDPADEIPEIASSRIVLLMRQRKRRKRMYARDAREVGDALAGVALHDREGFYLLLLEEDRRVFGVYVVGLGGPTGTFADKVSLMRAVLAAEPAGGVIVLHNHPSGVAEPSQADERITRRLKNALELIDVRVLDHFIVAAGGSVSMASRGIL